jgi:hypothetical protein
LKGSHTQPAARATVYLEPDLHRALSVKAAETDQTISELVNQAVHQSLIEDAEDLAACRGKPCFLARCRPTYLTGS